MSCSGDDDFTDREELLKGYWNSEKATGWQTIEFDGKHWNGTYENREGWMGMTGEYEWEENDFIHLTGTTTYDNTVDFRMKYVFGSYQTLVLVGTPDNSGITMQFSQFK